MYPVLLERVNIPHNSKRRVNNSHTSPDKAFRNSNMCRHRTPRHLDRAPTTVSKVQRRNRHTIRRLLPQGLNRPTILWLRESDLSISQDSPNHHTRNLSSANDSIRVAGVKRGIGHTRHPASHFCHRNRQGSPPLERPSRDFAGSVSIQTSTPSV
jgi:hypothetical protein